MPGSPTSGDSPGWHRDHRIGLASARESGLVIQADEVEAPSIEPLGELGVFGVRFRDGMAGASGGAIELTAPTDSIVERLGLFTIIVLGEVVMGVVDGMGEVELDAKTMATGFFALVVGFGLW